MPSTCKDGAMRGGADQGSAARGMVPAGAVPVASHHGNVAVACCLHLPARKKDFFIYNLLVRIH